MGVINRLFVEKLGGTEPSEYVGRPGDVFYDPTASTLELKKSDGSTAGGVALNSGGGGGGSTYTDSDVASFLNGNLNTHIIPDTNSVYDIGSAEYKIRHLFLSDNSIKFGNDELPLNVSGNRLQFNSVKLMTGIIDDTNPQLGGDLDVSGNSVKHTFILNASGNDHYVFTDAGNIWFPSGENDPILYLRRGEQYVFSNQSGGHPFEIRVAINEAAYSIGVTNNGIIGDVIFKVPMSAPSTLYYQCTAHPNMGGAINIV